MKSSSTDGAVILYHLELADKYERAASYLWLPVAPDTPEPQP